MAYGAPDNLPLSEEAYNCPGKPYRHSRLEAEKRFAKWVNAAIDKSSVLLRQPISYLTIHLCYVISLDMSKSFRKTGKSMPIKVPDSLPALEVLAKEGVDLIAENAAQHQDIRPLRLLLLNLMPKKKDTEIRSYACSVIARYRLICC